MEILKTFLIFGCFVAIFADPPITYCPAVLCIQPDCENTIQPPGQCCPTCPGNPNCEYEVCPRVGCNDPIKPEGACCPFCLPTENTRCDDIACITLYCENQKTPPGHCCPICAPPDTK